MSSQNDRLITFFHEYEKATNSCDVDKLLSQFTESFTVITAQGPQTVRASDFALFLPKRIALFQELGSQQTALDSLEITPLANHAAFVQTGWRMRFVRPEDRIEEFVVYSSFMVHLRSDGCRIFLYAPHQDIMEVFRERGMTA